MTASAYDRHPVVAVPGAANVCRLGWTEIAARLRQAGSDLIVVECYPGADEGELLRALTQSLRPALALRAADALLAPAAIEALVAPFLGGGDPVFGRLSDLALPQFFDRERVDALRRRLAEPAPGLKLVVGCGARWIAPEGLLVYADLARWEIQQRFRRGTAGNLGAGNAAASTAEKYKRAFFVDWRVADRWKQPLLRTADFWLDLHVPDEPKLADGAAIVRGWREAVSRPFRVVPFFDPAPWGGQWMKEHCGLDPAAPNYGWCFDCVPEENSLVFRFGDVRFELPALDLVLDQPRALLGDLVYERFGAEFPIRFDLLDTMGGGNLSLQVHPLAAYMRKHFGFGYTQDESYYLLDAAAGAQVFLGLQENVAPRAFAQALRDAQATGQFDPGPFAAVWPARRHDHFSIPAGTLHCSGKDSVVLEISATPYIFTFKLWDWGRLGLDGRPRPIHLDHGLANLQWDRTASWVKPRLVSPTQPVGEGDGYREERTGLDALEFIETRRHWFTGAVDHDTAGNLNVLNLVEGNEAVVESPGGRFAPFVVHYAETFIVPAAVGPYRIRPTGRPRSPLATLKAYVRAD